LTNPFLTKPNYIRIYGHRGARGDIVENSISGFRYTFDLGIRAVEFDVVISKDDIPVLFHDYRLNPDLVKDASGNWITDKNMKLVDLTYEEISKYNIESIKPDTKYAKRFKNQQSAKDERIPTLKDFFKLVTEDKYKDVFLNLEIKSTPTQENVTPDPEKMVSLILKDIKEFNLEDRTLITSYDFRILYALKKQNPNVLRGFITLQQGLSITKKNIYENSPWMVKNYPLEELSNDIDICVKTLCNQIPSNLDMVIHLIRNKKIKFNTDYFRMSQDKKVGIYISVVN